MTLSVAPTNGIKRAKRINSEQPCLVCGRYGVDPAHHPVRRSHGAGWGLLEIIPLCRAHHRRLDEGGEVWERIIEPLAADYHRRMYLCHNSTDVYLGPEERVREIAWNQTSCP